MIRGPQHRVIATVIICTRNRSASLRRTLDAIIGAAAVLDGALTRSWELLIVDNGRTDVTQSVVRSYEDRLPIRSTIQPEAGLSNARNAGIDVASGRYIIWTDDDVSVDVNWLAAYMQAFEKNPETDIFGGRAVPRYEEPVTPWFVRNEKSLRSLPAIRDMPEWTEIRTRDTPFGLHYAFRRDVQMRYRYDLDLGVAPGRRLGGEEATVIPGALRDGVVGLWVWGATVYHMIPPLRQTLSYIFDYYRQTGFQYPTIRVDANGAGPFRRLKTRLICLKVGCASLVRRILGRKGWVSSYVQYARWLGTYDLLKAGQPEDYRFKP